MRTPTTLLPLDFLESFVATTDPPCVLGCELLCGDWPSPVSRGGVGTAEVSIVGGRWLIL